MLSSLLESVIVTEFQATETYSSLDLTKVKYRISRQSMVEKENINILEHQHGDENEVYNQNIYT
jgi:hypothetical protein